MTSVTMAKVRAPKAKKNRTAGDWFILALLIVGGLVMLFPFIVLLLNAFKTPAITMRQAHCRGQRSSVLTV